MTAGTTAAEDRPGIAGFELERFEWTAPDRLEVAGRWVNVRGLRFMRPALDLHASEGRHRLLALLEHKPWAAEDGEEWVAAFPWEGDPVDFTAAELAVGPNVAVELSLPVVSEKPARGSKKARPRKSSSPARVRAARVRAGVSSDRAMAMLREGRDAALAARDAAVTERDVALAERDSARAARDAALAARERAPAPAEDDGAVRERDAAVAARGAALAELES